MARFRRCMRKSRSSCGSRRSASATSRFIVSSSRSSYRSPYLDNSAPTMLWYRFAMPANTGSNIFARAFDMVTSALPSSVFERRGCRGVEGGRTEKRNRKRKTSVSAWT